MHLLDYPFLVFALSFVLLATSAHVGDAVRRRRGRLDDAERDDLSLVLGASLTLLALVIGFTFSMATNRYDQRKSYEEAEANAIGTEYLRADLLPAEVAARTRRLLEDYVQQRVLFYTTRDSHRLREINAVTSRLQSELWTTVRMASTAAPNPLTALAVAGMNDTLNSQGYAQSAWWNRIPGSAWILMLAIGICCNAMFGYNGRYPEGQRRRLFALPLIAAVAFLLISDVDSPRGGLIRVSPYNLDSVQASLHPAPPPP
jgi:hypothetical protein